jgi:putative endonuclease
VPAVALNVGAIVSHPRITHATIRRLRLGKRRRASLYYVYILRSIDYPDQSYIGSTSDLKKRFAERNAGKSIHTNKFKLRELVVYIAVPERFLAEKLENYLKSGSGCEMEIGRAPIEDSEMLSLLD